MIRAVFIDYMGTLVKEDNPYVQEVIGRCFTNSNAKKPLDILHYWFQYHDALLEKYNGETYRTEYDISIETFGATMEHFKFSDDAKELCAILEKHWMYSPIFNDVTSFFKECPVPIYIVTSNDTKYVEEGVRYHGLTPAGIISSEMAHAYKPQKELFQKALNLSGFMPDEVIHIGDSIRADVQGATNSGIIPWLLDRTRTKNIDHVTVIHSLEDALALIKKN